MKNMTFTFSDTIAGYVKMYDWDNQTFTLETSDGRPYNVKLTDTTFAELVRNFGEPYIDCSGQMKDMLAEGRFLYAHGIFYPENNQLNFEAKHIVFLGRTETEYRFEGQDWWIKQVKALADFYLEAQFEGGEIDYSKYRTTLNLEGGHEDTTRQETDTISRLVYGFASAYMMTGEEHYLEAAEKGTKYLREHFKCSDNSEDITYWYHAIDVKDGKTRKILASEFGDDYNAIPAYEQIYALAGPTQTYRVTGNNETLRDIENTVNLFDKYFLDRKQGGYFSHIDPITFDPRSEALGTDRSRKNWNSVGDHAPAYLINLWLATGEERYKSMLKYTADTITEHFQDYDHSPFVQEKFHEDWSHDQQWGWQQNRGVVGHNLKIAWNLTRMNNVIPAKGYMEFAEKIAEIMPQVGGDLQRGGWYDVMERELGKGEEFHRFAWHDRKAWWQQEQGILAYLIMAGVMKKEEYLKLARESAAFYNTWFLDHDSGGIYFNVLANGLPYLLGTERMKGSHSMSGYHSFELAYLAAVYTNLLITKEHMDFYFKPYANSFADNILRVQPDMLPDGSVKIEKVWIDGKEYDDFDADGLFVRLPQTEKRVKVQVRIVPAVGAEHFEANVTRDKDITKLQLIGEFDTRALTTFKQAFAKVINDGATKVAIIVNDLDEICKEGIRAIIFETQKLSLDTEVYIIGATEELKQRFTDEQFDEGIIFAESLESVQLTVNKR
ncbi:AGE family epimerase/isomerase [Bacillus solimangrovi]|uniref:N-acyl-D-glucosamine 2-epimerase n=1 Tax=Bacillus solimangrovi TaxID=1305675 RepID=A0A1E5LID7_9BACI|nr:AGE family epimerase/isomerase [Bacillus solimangrovi]OEH93831.1 N-acyl-D-glucosamine 2-epimerase [Bacillus solimangrovi]